MRKDNVSVKNVKTINVKTGEVKQSRVETTTLDERPSIWNLQAFVIVFLFIMLGTTINVYSLNNDNLTWVDSNGDFKVNSYDHSMINLDTDLVELNNQSLNDVFLNNNLVLNYNIVSDINNDGRADNWNVFNNLSNFYITDNIQYGVSNALKQGFYQTMPYLNGHDYYIRLDYVSNTRIDWYAYYYLQQLPIVTQLSSYSFIKTWTYPTGNFTTGIRDFYSTNNTYGFTNVYLLNLTALGIDNLTQSQMDEYYDLYVSLQENRIEAYKDLGNEPISQWQNLTQVLSDIMDAVAGPISDTIDWIDKFMFGLFS